MSKFTKRQLEEQLDILQHENRRFKRAMNQLCIDIDKTVELINKTPKKPNKNNTIDIIIVIEIYDVKSLLFLKFVTKFCL